MWIGRESLLPRLQVDLVWITPFPGQVAGIVRNAVIYSFTFNSKIAEEDIM
jgi:hypothetical protein